MSNRMTVAEKLCTAVTREIRQLWLSETPARPALPPPHDMEAEEVVLSAALCGHLSPLRSELATADLYHPLHRAVWAILEGLEELGKPIQLPIIRRALIDQGLPPEQADKELRRIRDQIPFRIDLPLYEQRVIKLALARQLLRTMSRLDAIWRSGADPPKQMISQLIHSLGAIGRM